MQAAGVNGQGDDAVFRNPFSRVVVVTERAGRDEHIRIARIEAVGNDLAAVPGTRDDLDAAHDDEA